MAVRKGESRRRRASPLPSPDSEGEDEEEGEGRREGFPGEREEGGRHFKEVKGKGCVWLGEIRGVL